VEHVAMAVALGRCLPDLRFRLRLVDRAGLRTVGGYSFHALVALLAGRISFQTDALVISTFLAPQFITFFVIAARLTEHARNSLRSVTSVLTPAVSTWEAREDHGAIRRVLLDGSRWVLWFILPIEAGLILLGAPFLALWLGPEYARLSYPTLVILALPLGLAMSQSITGRILYGIGRLGWFSRAVMAEALANLVLSIVLVRPLGIAGVALGTAVPNVLFNLFLAGYICRALGIRPAAYVRRVFLPPLLAASPLAAFWLGAVAWEVPASWPALLGTGAAGLAGYLAVVALLEFGPGAVIARLRLTAGIF
jgi:O-antigen/teichoic acid export membrane protein